MKIEIWKNIPSYNGVYQVSNHGKVRSTTRYNANGVLIIGKILTPQVNRDSHITVRLHKDDKQKSVGLARLVLQVHKPDNEDRSTCLAIPKDGDHENTHVDNLKWVERVDFNKDNSTPDDVVREIKSLYSSGMTQVGIGRKLGINRTTVNRIVCGKRRKNVK